MTNSHNHPLLLARLRAGLSQVELARRVDVTPMTVSKIERGLTRTPSPSLMHKFGLVLDTTGETLQRRIDGWFATLRPEEFLSIRAQAILRQSPASLEHDFDSFRAWRAALGVPTNLFATLVGVSATTVLHYERGIRTSGLSTHYRQALLHLGISFDYLNALERLAPTSTGPDATFDAEGTIA